MIIKIKIIDITAVLPQRNQPGDAGYDLYALEDGYIWGGQRQLFKTGIAVAIPDGYYGRIAARSGLALKRGIDVLGGVIDSTYRGDVGIILINLNNDSEKSEPFYIRKGDRIAQLIIEKYHDIEWEVVENLEESDRSEKGFGSSGN